MRKGFGLLLNATVWAGLCASILTAVLGGTAEQKPIIGCDQLGKAFVGFSFAGQSPCTAAKHFVYDMRRRPLPTTFQEGVCYTYRYPNTGEQPVYELLERRLQSKVNILSSPATGGNLVYPMMGGPLFHIDFEIGPHKGTITAVSSPEIAGSASLRQKWLTEEFVLFFPPTQRP